MLKASDYRYRIELHAHCKPISPCASATPADIVREYRELGFDMVVLTNHFYQHSIYDRFTDGAEAADYYYGTFEELKAEADKYHFPVLFGMEAVFLPCDGEYLLYGIGKEDIKKVFDHHTEPITEYLKEYTEATRPCVIQAHPTRNGVHFSAEGPFDGIEVFNMHLNSDIRLALRYAREHHLMYTGSSDYHDPTQGGLACIRTRILQENEFALRNLLLSRDFLIEVDGNIVIPEYRIHEF